MKHFSHWPRIFIGELIVKIAVSPTYARIERVSMGAEKSKGKIV